MELEEYLKRQKEWSNRTFGSGLRTQGITRHIEKELAEIRDNPTDIEEWIDVMILAMDGFWRAGGHPSMLEIYLRSKQNINFERKWPKDNPEDEPSEHIR